MRSTATCIRGAQRRPGLDASAPVFGSATHPTRFRGSFGNVFAWRVLLCLRCISGVAAGAVLCYSATLRGAAASQLQQPPTSYPLCTANSLAGFPWTHPAFGHAVPGIALRNMSLETCRVAGYPELRAYVASGARAPIEFVRAPFLDTRIYAYTVVPGAAVFFALYGHPPRGEFDRSCVGITQVDVTLPDDTRAIDVTMSTGTCGGRMSYSQLFPASELSP